MGSVILSLSFLACSTLGDRDPVMPDTETDSSGGVYGYLGDGGDSSGDGGSSSSDGGDTDGDGGADLPDPDDDCVESVWYADGDNDGFGDPDTTMSACEEPEGYVDNDADLNDGNSSVGDVTVICAVASNGEAFSVAVENLSNGNQTHWFDADGEVPDPLFVSSTDSDWCAEYPEAGRGDTLKLSGLGTTDYGYGDFLVYACGGDDGDSIFYDGDTTCAVILFTVNGYDVTEVATNTYDFQYN